MATDVSAKKRNTIRLYLNYVWQVQGMELDASYITAAFYGVTKKQAQEIFKEWRKEKEAVVAPGAPRARRG